MIDKRTIRAQQIQVSLEVAYRDVPECLRKYLSLLERAATVPETWPLPEDVPEGYEGLKEMLESMASVGESTRTIMDWIIEKGFLVRTSDNLVAVGDSFRSLGTEQYQQRAVPTARSSYPCVKTYLPVSVTKLIKGAYAYGRTGIDAEKVLTSLTTKGEHHGESGNSL